MEQGLTERRRISTKVWAWPVYERSRTATEVWSGGYSMAEIGTRPTKDVESCYYGVIETSRYN